ncbi:MAG: AAA family ATPase [Gammaproteobacteria bacterium]|nr:AAA family ATPase [Gammaproteobacteria bacterium]
MALAPEKTVPPARHLLDAVIQRIGHIVLGKERQARLALACLLARGHLLIEDLPGVGKTTLAHVLAGVLGLQFKRIQFTADLLPADILGVSIYQPENKLFVFHPGPLFAQLVLADEINRATPKTQSALLEAMEERQVTADGVTHKLPEPFFVIATQNPHHLIGTFPLPESQLDRFLMRIEMGYPDRAAERALLKGRDRRELVASLQPVISADKLAGLQRHVAHVHVADPLLDYVQNLLDATRRAGEFAEGLSPRAGLSLLAASRAWALLAGRDMVLPEDVQAVAPSVIGHRLRPVSGGRAVSVARLLESVPIP